MQKDYNAICSVSERLKFYDCDYKGRMKISAILKLSAELAGYDYAEKGISHEYLWENQMVFLLSRISVKILNYSMEQEMLNISTWERGKKGAMFLRGTDIFTENGNRVASLSSGWILTNPVTRHIYKPSAFEFDMPQLTEKEVLALPIGKISCEKPKSLGERTVRISDLDSNGHVYNAIYADIACDFLEKSQFEKNVDNFRINYISEAVLGNTIDIFSEEDAEKTVIIGKVQEKLCFETEFVWAK